MRILAVFVFSLVFSLALSFSAPAATVDGIPIHSTSLGSGDKTVVFVHGWTCDDSSWSAQTPALSKSYRVITLDLPGHGKSGSPKNEPLTMELFARAVEAVRAEAGADKIVLVGHSMGTPVIRQYARMYPARVAALVPVDGLVRLPGGGAGGGSGPNAEAMRGPDGMKSREAMIRGMFTPKTPADLRQHILKMMLGPSEATAYQAMTATLAASNWTDETMTMPVLGIYADGSGLGGADSLKQVFPNSEYVEIPGTGHFLMMEKPDQFNRLLVAFLQTRVKD